MLKKITFIVLITLFITACQDNVTNKPAMALFVEQELDIEPYKTRIIVTADYMRLDDGNDASDFALLDRKARKIYSTSSENNTIIAVSARKVDIEPPMPLAISNDKVTATANVPTVAGKTPEHYALSVNGKVCYEVMAVKGMLPDMVKAMQEFAEILAGDSAVTFNSIPADMQNACDMAGNTFAPGRHLQFGFPVSEWKKGYSRTLMEYKDDFKVEPALFELPKGYFQYDVQDYREGKVKNAGIN